MSEPSEPSAFDFQNHIATVGLFIQVLVRDLVWPKDATYLPETSIVE